MECGYKHEGIYGSHKRTQDHLQLELQEVVSCQMQVLGAEPQSFAIAGSTLNCSAISVPHWILIYDRVKEM